MLIRSGTDTECGRIHGTFATDTLRYLINLHSKEMFLYWTFMGLFLKLDTYYIDLQYKVICTFNIINDFFYSTGGRRAYGTPDV